MKRNTLTTAVVASIAGVAGIASVSNAVFLNPDGVGQVLIYPYFTVNAGNDTLLSVVNTTNQGKAVKVRFIEGRNSFEVLDFNLYLSPFDVWTAAITTATTSATDPAVLTTFDNSCTVPTIKGNTNLPVFAGTTQTFVPFRNNLYAGADAGPDGLERTREGYFEMIEMGVLNNTTLNTLKNITHVNGVPRDCGAVNAAWSNIGGVSDYLPAGGLFTAIDTTTPTGGLFGGAAVVNVAAGTYINYNADAIEDFTSDLTLHSSPGELSPSLNNANNAPGGSITDVFGTIPANGARSIVFDNGRIVVSNWPSAAGVARPAPGQRVRSIDAVSAVLAQDTIANEFVTDSSIGAASEWVVTFPTKRFYANQSFIGQTTAILPFTRVFPLQPAAPTPDGNGTACVDIGLRFYDREEGTVGGGILDFSPSPNPGAGPQLCFEAQVVTFNQTLGAAGSRILGSTYARNISTSQASTFQNPNTFNAGAGWAAIKFLAASGTFQSPATASNTSCNDAACAEGIRSFRYVGLPVTGFWALTVANNNASPGVRGNYGGAFRHRGSRDCVGPAGNTFCVN
jgi:hypothetical protein